MHSAARFVHTHIVNHFSQMAMSESVAPILFSGKKINCGSKMPSPSNSWRAMSQHRSQRLVVARRTTCAGRLHLSICAREWAKFKEQLFENVFVGDTVEWRHNMCYIYICKIIYRRISLHFCSKNSRPSPHALLSYSRWQIAQNTCNGLPVEPHPCKCKVLPPATCAWPEEGGKWREGDRKEILPCELHQQNDTKLRTYLLALIDVMRTSDNKVSVDLYVCVDNVHGWAKVNLNCHINTLCFSYFPSISCQNCRYITFGWRLAFRLLFSSQIRMRYFRCICERPMCAADICRMANATLFYLPLLHMKYKCHRIRCAIRK